jgi:hypothetical protein
LVRGVVTLTVTMSHPNSVTEHTVTLTLPTPTITQATPWHIV